MNLRQLVERGDRPFAAPPQVARYFPAASIEDARSRLARSIERGDGPGAVIGVAGMGKSLLLQVLAAQYRERFDVVLLACAQLCTRRALLQAIHFELGLDYRRRDEGELRLSLLDTLLAGDETTEGLLLLVDESQALAVHLLEELRLLTNLSRGGAPRVRLVLAGLPSLEEKLACPELQSFSQRLSARGYLVPLTRAETAQYVRAQLAVSHVDADQLFAPPAFESVFAATDGVPRLVNQLCDRALVFAEASQLEQIDAAVIQAAWADLQQLPSAWEPPTTAAPTTADTSSIVEFGSLSESPTTETPAVTPDEATELDEDDPLEPVRATVSKANAPAKPESEPTGDWGLGIADCRNPKPAIRNPKSEISETVNPFAEEFEEEELVLESFITLANLFGTRAPRVENGREPGISRLVQHALDASAAAGNEGTGTPSTGPTAEPSQAPTQSTIRLAVMNDAASSAVTESPRQGTARETPRSRPAAAATSPPINDESADTAAAILVIEDEPASLGQPPPGVRRESYRQLFSRLRYGA